MKTMRSLVLATALAVGLSGCDKFLEKNPVGTIAGEQLNTSENVEGMVTAAYAALGNDHWITPYTSMGPYGDLRSGDAYKGGGGTGDVNEYNGLEQFVFVQPTYGPLDNLWYRLYVGVGRANDALRRLGQTSDATFPQKAARQAEMRFVRG